MTINTENFQTIKEATRIKKWVYKVCMIQNQYTNQLYYYMLKKNMEIKNIMLHTIVSNTLNI